MSKESIQLMAIAPGISNHLFRFSDSAGDFSSITPNFITTKVKLEPEVNFISGEYMPWGAINDWPNKVRTEVKKNAYALSLLEHKIIPSHYSRGIYPVMLDEQGNYKIYFDDDIKTFWRLSNIPKLQKQIVAEYEHLANYFPEIILDKQGKKITYAKMHSSFKSRWGKQDKNGYTNELFLSSNFPYYSETSIAKSIPALKADLPYIDFINRDHKPGESFALQIRMGLWGKEYYDEAPWHALVSSWLPLANAVPEIKKAIAEHNMTLKYQIDVPMEYFRKKAELDGESKLTSALMKKYFTEFLDMLNTFLSGKENAGKTFVTPSDYYIKNGKETWCIKITPIEDTMKDGSFLSDNYQANVEIAQGMGIDISQTGRTKGGSEDGSGSSKEQAHSINLELQFFRQEHTASWLNIVRDCNGWSQDIKFMYMDFSGNFQEPKIIQKP